MPHPFDGLADAFAARLKADDRITAWFKKHGLKQPSLFDQAKPADAPIPPGSTKPKDIDFYAASKPSGASPAASNPPKPVNVPPSSAKTPTAPIFGQTGHYDPAKHPHKPAGDAHGGEFAPKGGSGYVPKPYVPGPLDCHYVAGPDGKKVCTNPLHVEVTPTGPSSWSDPAALAVWSSGSAVPKVMNGIPFQTWKKPEGGTWNSVSGQNPFPEPPMPPEFKLEAWQDDKGKWHAPKTGHVSAGVIMVEPDGRYWVVQPRHNYGGYCVPLDTEILTRDGWKSYTDIRIGDETIGFDPITGLSRWTKVTEIHRFEDLPMVRYGNEKWSVRCTPNHRWLIQGMPEVTRAEILAAVHSDQAQHLTEDRLANDYAFTEAKDGIRKGRSLRLAAEHLEASNVIYPQDAAVLAWILTDGSICRARGTGVWVARITQWKPEGVEALDHLLSTIPHSKYKHGGGWNYYLHSAYVQALLLRVGWTKRADIVKIVLGLGQEALSAFMDAAYMAEGEISQGRKRLWQNNGPMQDAIALGLYRMGYRPSIKGKRRCRSISGNLPTVRGWRIEAIEDGRADAWCVTTELGTWTMRQGDNIALTGNSHTFPKGTVDKGETLQAAAIRETWEESGLKARLVGYLGDYKGDTSISRYYFAVRSSGTPADFGHETHQVKLVPPDQLRALFNKKRDQQIFDDLVAKGFIHLPPTPPVEYVYHGTAAANLPAIKAAGLTPNAEGNPLNFHDIESSAKYYAGDGGALLRVAKSSLPKATTHDALTARHWTQEKVAPYVIEVLTPDGWRPLAGKAEKATALDALAESFVASLMLARKAWEEEKHPRKPAGDKAGGQFAPAGSMVGPVSPAEGAAAAALLPVALPQEFYKSYGTVSDALKSGALSTADVKQMMGEAAVNAVTSGQAKEHQSSAYWLTMSHVYDQALKVQAGTAQPPTLMPWLGSVDGNALMSEAQAAQLPWLKELEWPPKAQGLGSPLFAADETQDAYYETLDELNKGITTSSAIVDLIASGKYGPPVIAGWKKALAEYEPPVPQVNVPVAPPFDQASAIAKAFDALQVVNAHALPKAMLKAYLNANGTEAVVEIAKIHAALDAMERAKFPGAHMVEAIKYGTIDGLLKAEAHGDARAAAIKAELGKAKPVISDAVPFQTPTLNPLFTPASQSYEAALKKLQDGDWSIENATQVKNDFIHQAFLITQKPVQEAWIAHGHAVEEAIAAYQEQPAAGADKWTGAQEMLLNQHGIDYNTNGKPVVQATFGETYDAVKKGLEAGTFTEADALATKNHFDYLAGLSYGLPNSFKGDAWAKHADAVEAAHNDYLKAQVEAEPVPATDNLPTGNEFSQFEYEQAMSFLKSGDWTPESASGYLTDPVPAIAASWKKAIDDFKAQQVSEQPKAADQTISAMTLADLKSGKIAPAHVKAWIDESADDVWAGEWKKALTEYAGEFNQHEYDQAMDFLKGAKITPQEAEGYFTDPVPQIAQAWRKAVNDYKAFYLPPENAGIGGMTPEQLHAALAQPHQPEPGETEKARRTVADMADEFALALAVRFKAEAEASPVKKKAGKEWTTVDGKACRWVTMHGTHVCITEAGEFVHELHGDDGKPTKSVTFTTGQSSTIKKTLSKLERGAITPEKVRGQISNMRTDASLFSTAASLEHALAIHEGKAGPPEGLFKPKKAVDPNKPKKAAASLPDLGVPLATKVDVQFAGANPDTVASWTKSERLRDPAALAALTGAPDGAKVSVGASMKKGIKLSVVAPDMTYTMYVTKGAGGMPGVKVTDLYITQKAPPDALASLVARQVQGLSAAGVKTLRLDKVSVGEHTQGAREQLIKMGFDGVLPPDFLMSLPVAFPIKGINRVSDLTATPAGAKLWSGFGGQVRLEFNTSPRSQSVKSLAAYMQALKGGETPATSEPIDTTTKGYSPVAGAKQDGHWVTINGAHILLQERPPAATRAPTYGDTVLARRNVQNKLLSGEWGDPVAHGYATMESALDDFLGDPEGNDAMRMKCVAALIWRGRVLYSYDGTALTKDKTAALAKSKEGELLARAMKAQYAETQRMLKELYPSGLITLYRGVRNKSGKIKPGDDVVDVESNALESWTTDRDRAAVFAKKSQTGVVFEAHIPIASVWASWHSQSDLHRMNEDEAIVLGDTKPFRSRVVMNMADKEAGWRTE